VYEVITIKRSDGRSKKHGFIIRMRSDEKEMMFFLSFSAAFVKVDCKEGDKVEPKQNILERRVKGAENLFHQIVYTCTIAK
jgi:hypothetical protein